jgi:hypothetical protein
MADQARWHHSITSDWLNADRRELAVALDRQRLFRCGVQAHRIKPLNRYPTGYPGLAHGALASDFAHENWRFCW